MDQSYKGIAALAALIVLSAIPATGATVYVDSAVGTDVIGCGTAQGASACASIQYAIDLASTVNGDVIDVAAGSGYAESVVVNKELTLNGNGVAVVTPPATSLYGFSIGASNVTIDDFEISGSSAATTMWAGIQMFGGYTGVSITDNEIHGFDGFNPASTWGAGSTIKYAYGIWTMGGGSVGARDPISGLTITGNNIYDLGDGGTTGGVGMYLKSIFGASAGTGAVVQGNTIDEMATGPTETSGVAFTFVGVGIAVLQDDDGGTEDSGVQIGGDSGGQPNTFGNGAGTDMVVGVDIQTDNSSVDQAKANFGSGVTAYVINKPATSGGALIATIDEDQLAPFVKSESVDVNGASAGTPFDGVVGYFSSMTAASANSNAGTPIELVPTDTGGAPISAAITYVAPTITITIGGDMFTVDKTALEGAGQQLVVTGTTGNDDLTINPDAIPSTGFFFDAGDGDDTLTLAAGGSLNTSYVHTPGTIGTCSTGENGDIAFNTTGDITYCGLTPIIDLTVMASKTFTMTAADETITIVQDPAEATRTLIDSATMESVSFVNPTATLIVNAGDGDDIIDFDGLGTSNAGTLTTVTLNGEGDEDSLLIDPVLAATYTALTIGANGGAPAICQGDLLDFEVAGGQTLTFTPDPPADGTATFTGVVDVDVTYTGIERFADEIADLQLVSITLDDDNLYAGDDALLTVVITNNGTDSAQCLQVDLSSLPGVLNIDEDNSVAGFDPTVTAGTFDRTTKIWALSSLAASGSATLTLPFVVDTQLSGDFNIAATVSASNTDPVSNNTGDVDLTIEPSFTFPAKGHPISAAFKTLDSGLERMLLGTYLGSPGINGAVWCRVPTPDGDMLNLAGAPDTYRVCSDGLPNVSGSFLPLHVNDIWLDDDGTNAGRYYLTTWGSDGLYYSDDDGETWTSAEPDIGDGHNGASGSVIVYGITEDATDNILYISVNNGLIFRSLNGGTNWQQVSSLPEGSADTAWMLLSHPTTAGLLFAGTAGKGVYVSENFGISWAALADNATLSAANADYIFDLELREDGGADYLFAATSRGVWRMDYAGAKTWAELSTNQTTFTPTGVRPEVRSIEFGEDTSSPADGEPDLYAVTWGFGVLRDETPFSAPAADMAEFALRGSEMTFFAVSPSGMLYAGTQDGAFYEMDPSSPVESGTSVAVDPALETPDSYALMQNYPNPFNPVTTIGFTVPEASEVRIAVYDVLGRPVRVLLRETMTGGLHEVQFDASSLPSGTYFYSLETPGAKVTRRMVLLK